jgi:hypothetical protein
VSVPNHADPGRSHEDLFLRTRAPATILTKANPRVKRELVQLQEGMDGHSLMVRTLPVFTSERLALRLNPRSKRVGFSRNH